MIDQHRPNVLMGVLTCKDMDPRWNSLCHTFRTAASGLLMVCSVVDGAVLEFYEQEHSEVFHYSVYDNPII